MKQPAFSHDDVKFAADKATFERARNLYQSGKVKRISETPFGYSATVQGTHPYTVSLSSRRLDEGDCNCYMGQRDRLCKHMLALALAVLFHSGKIDETRTEDPPPTELAEVRKRVTAGMQKLQPYNGPSRIWFSYQRKLATGAGIIAHAVSGLPPTRQNADYLWRLIERLDRKLANTVDDSDGVVGECAEKIIRQLADYAKQCPELAPTISRYTGKKTNFDFADTLQALL